MQLNLQMEGGKNGGLEEALIRKMNEKEIKVMLIDGRMDKEEIKVMVTNAVRQEIVPIFEEFHKAVKEEIQSPGKKLLPEETRNSNVMTLSKERSLQLEFSGQVSDPVLTGKELQGKGGKPMKVSLLDRTTKQVVNCGPESSAKVEIVLDASGDDNEHNCTYENFNNRIIKEGDKRRPHFAKSFYVKLEEGVGILRGAKLGHDSSWMKSCKCRLGARIMENLEGIKVQEAWTEAFRVLDSRNTLYVKHSPPSLSSEVWRLKNIARYGDPRKHLNKENIKTVQDFLVLHSINPQRLEQIVRDATKTWKHAMWKATVDHAKTCNIGDERMYCHSTESKMGVIFDAVRGLKGVIQESHYVPIENLPAGEKDSAHESLLSAFENRKNITPYDNEASLLQQFPYRSSDINASTNSSTEEGPTGSDPNVSENVDELHPTEPGTSFQSISPYTRISDHSNSIFHCGSLGSRDMGQPYDATLNVPVQFPRCQYAPTDSGTSSQGICPYMSTSDHPNHTYQLGSPESTYAEQMLMDLLLESPNWQSELTDLENINGYAHIDPDISSQSISPSIRTSDLPNNSSHFCPLGLRTMGQLSEPHFGIRNPSCQSFCSDSTSETPAESHSHQPRNSRAYYLVGLAMNVVRWVGRLKKKVTALEGIHVQKKQRI